MKNLDRLRHALAWPLYVLSLFIGGEAFNTTLRSVYSHPEEDS